MPSQTLYMDRVVYRERVWEAAWRRGSFEFNESSGGAKGVRIATPRGWIVVSGPRTAEWKSLEERANRLARAVKGAPRLAEAKLFRGRSLLARPPSAPDEDLLGLVMAAAGLLEEKNMGGEVIATLVDSTRLIEHPEGEARERLIYTELYVYAEISEGARRAVGSASAAWLGGPGELKGRELEELVEKAARRAVYSFKARPLTIFESGRHEVILGGEASAAFFHEVAHLLEADQPEHLRTGTRISNLSITLRDDPFIPGSPASRLFDDQAVATSRRVLVEEGVVVNLLHTRDTAASMHGKPGSARGLFHAPKAMHTNLIVSPGDWGEKELVEETRKGLLVDGVVAAEFSSGTVRIVPEEVWRIEKGEPRHPLRIGEVRLPLAKSLTTIAALGRRLHRRHGYEKKHVTVEATPWVKLQAYVM